MQKNAPQATLPNRLRWLAPGLALLLAAGCASVATAPTAAPGQAAAIALLEQGQAREAAQ